MSTQPTLTITLPLEVYEQAVATLESARHTLRMGADVHTQMKVGQDCWHAWYERRKAIVHPEPIDYSAAEQWVRDSMSPDTRATYFPE